jgi:general secretion pathway protein K
MRTRRKQKGERGFALIAVTVLAALATAIVFDFAYSTNVDYASAANTRDEMRAHYLARSVMNMSRLSIKFQHDILDKNRRALAGFGFPDVQISDFTQLLETPVCGSAEEVQSFTDMMGTIDSGGVKGLGISFGQCRVEKLESDDAKINVNCANGAATTVTALATQLTGLVTPPVYDRLFEERDADGQFTDRPTFIKALIDYVDRDEAGYGASGTPEDYGYEALPDPYRAKNNYLDSIDELQLVRGMDDRKWEVFGSQFTVYGGCKINVAATSSPVQIMGILYQAAKDPADPVVTNINLLWMLSVRVAQARAFGFPFEDLNSFVQFVKDPDAVMGAGLPTEGGDGTSMFGPPVQGLELDAQKLSQVAKAGPRRTYRVTASATVGKVEKRITGVFDTETHNQNMRDPKYNRGAWVYWREE